MMEAVSISETLVCFFDTARPKITDPAGCYRHSRSRENLKSHKSLPVHNTFKFMTD
jgi:hypothetical protein